MPDTALWARERDPDTYVPYLGHAPPARCCSTTARCSP